MLSRISVILCVVLVLALSFYNIVLLLMEFIFVALSLCASQLRSTRALVDNNPEGSNEKRKKFRHKGHQNIIVLKGINCLEA